MLDLFRVSRNYAVHTAGILIDLKARLQLGGSVGVFGSAEGISKHR